MRRLIAVATIVVTALVGFATVAGAEPGDLDGAFGRCGFADTDVWDGTAFDLAEQVLALPHGKTLQTYTNHENRPAATRLDAGGLLDRTYGTKGTATVASMTGLPSGIAPNTYVAPDGSVYLVGYVAGVSGLKIARLDPNGGRDLTFGTGGFLSVPHLASRVVAGTVRADGRLLLVTDGGELAIQRFTVAGAVDPTFSLAMGFLPAGDLVDQVTTDAWGRILVQTQGGAPPGHLGLYRFGPDGAPDPGLATTFGVPVGISAQYWGRALAAHADGSVDLGFRREYVPDPGVGLVRHDSVLLALAGDGTPVTGFGTGGWLTLDHPDSAPADLTRLADGSLVVSGTTTDGALNGPLWSTYLEHLDATGAPDPAFPRSTYGLIDGGGNTAGTRGIAVAADHFDVGVAARGGFGASAVLRVRRDALAVGAGLTLEWNGLMWPSRFGRNGGPPCPDRGPFWGRTDMSRGVSAVTGAGGYVVDAFGKLYRFSLGRNRPKPGVARGNPVWPGWDIARGVAARLDGSGGYTLDAYGGLHPWHTATGADPPATVDGPYWPGWDITRGVALMPDGTNGYILDGFGGLHPFTTPGHPRPPETHTSGYWPGRDVAQGIAILPDGTGGYVVDRTGKVFPFSIGAHAAPPRPGPNAPYAAGVDWVRGFTFVPPMSPTPALRHAATAATPDPVVVDRHRTITAAPH